MIGIDSYVGKNIIVKKPIDVYGALDNEEWEKVEWPPRFLGGEIGVVVAKGDSETLNEMLKCNFGYNYIEYFWPKELTIQMEWDE